MDTTTPQVTIPTACANIASAARVAMDLGFMDADTALDAAANIARRCAHDARTRHGIWAHETRTEQIDAMLFQGSVAADILDGTTERPSTGNVRAYALQLLTEAR